MVSYQTMRTCDRRPKKMKAFFGQDGDKSGKLYAVPNKQTIPLFSLFKFLSMDTTMDKTILEI